MYNEKAAVYRMLMAVIEGGRKGRGTTVQWCPRRNTGDLFNNVRRDAFRAVVEEATTYSYDRWAMPMALLDIARKTLKQRVTAPSLSLEHVHVMCSMYELRMGI